MSTIDMSLPTPGSSTRCDFVGQSSAQNGSRSAHPQYQLNSACSTYADSHVDLRPKLGGRETAAVAIETHASMHPCMHAAAVLIRW